MTALVTAGLARRTASVDAARSDAPRRRAPSSPTSSTSSSPAPAPRAHAERDDGRPSPDPPHPQPRANHARACRDGAVVGIDADGNVQEFLGGLLGTGELGTVTLPNGVNADDLDVTALQAGDTQKGRDGDTVFQAEPLTKVQAGSPRSSCSPTGQHAGRSATAAAPCSAPRSSRSSSPRSSPRSSPAA